MFARALRPLLLTVMLAEASAALAASEIPRNPTLERSLSADDEAELRALYQRLIEAEDRHDIAAVRSFVWNSPDALFVAKTATAAEGNWAGFWGTEVVLQHLDDLYKAGPFHIEPDYNKEKIVALSRDVAETYVPVTITVAYAGQDPVPKPFLMILEWVRTPEGWRMASDIALPIPPAPRS
jgi:hypothetical protein